MCNNPQGLLVRYNSGRRNTRRKFCLVYGLHYPFETNVAVAGHRSSTWTGTIHKTVPEAEIMGAAAFLLHTHPAGFSLHVVDATIIGAHLRGVQDALYRGIKEPTLLISCC